MVTYNLPLKVLWTTVSDKELKLILSNVYATVSDIIEVHLSIYVPSDHYEYISTVYWDPS